MSDLESPAVMMARLRAEISSALPTLPDRRAALLAAADRAGRRVVDASRPGNPVATLGWLDGAEPSADPDAGIKRITAAPTMLLTFAAALRCCWEDPQTHPWPGKEVSEADVLAALRSIAPGGGDDLTGPGAERHQRGALRKLRQAGLLDPISPGVRFGPKVAAWTDSQIDELRGHHQRLPACTNQESP